MKVTQVSQRAYYARWGLLIGRIAIFAFLTRTNVIPLLRRACFDIPLSFPITKSNGGDADEIPSSSKSRGAVARFLGREKPRVSLSINRAGDYQVHQLFYRTRCG